MPVMLLAGRHDGIAAPSSAVVQVGKAPEGFGKYVEWAPQDQQLALIAFINAADPMGVAILGATPGDTLDLIFASGLASFSEEVENEGVPAFIGIVAAGATLGASAFGFPEAAPVIAAGAQFAKEKFKEKLVRTMVRDPFGEDPSSHLKARREGGVLICRPEARGVYSSGRDQEFWIKPPGDRKDSNRPPHLEGKANFIRRGMERTMCREGGAFVLQPWDHIFQDNQGFYELHLIMRRGDLPEEPVVE
jgi:hypothetical protein